MSEILETTAQEQPVKPQKVKKVRKPRSVPVKILMGLIAFILCIVMFVVSFVGVTILDIRAVVSRDGISQIISQLISGNVFSAPQRPALAVTVGKGVGYPAAEMSAGGNMSGMLVDWAYDMIKDQFGDELPITKEQVQTFVEESTVKDFVADKVAGLVEDFYAGESETTITVEEITQLIDENKEIIQEQFGVTITQEAVDAVEQMLEESEILAPIEEQGLLDYVQQSMGGTAVPDTDPDSSGSQSDSGIQDGSGSQSGSTTGNSGSQLPSASPMETVSQIMELVRTATSYTTVAILGGAFALLLVLLFFVTGRSIPATLADTGVVLTLTGLIFSAPTAVCVFNPQLCTSILGDPVGGIVVLIFRAASTVNFTVLGLGAALIVGAIVAKIVKNIHAKKQAA